MKDDKEDKQMAILYFKSKNIDARKFPKTSRKKNPDFILNLENNPFGYCELKSIDPFYWPDNLPSCQPYESLHNDSAFNAIQNKVHEASNQLKAVNPKHEIPNIILFINHHQGRGPGDLRTVITGQISMADPDILWPVYAKRLLERNDLSHIDYFIWIDIRSNKAYYYIQKGSNFQNILKEKICSKCFEILPDLHP